MGMAISEEMLCMNHHLARVYFHRALSLQVTSLQFDDECHPSLSAAVCAGIGEAFLQLDLYIIIIIIKTKITFENKGKQHLVT
jgi:hypothetical protein